MLEIHAFIDVEDVEAGAAFYTQALGLTVRRRMTARWIELEGGAIPVHVLGGRPAEFEAGEALLRRDFGRHWTPVHLDFIVEDLPPAVERAVAAGGLLEGEADHPGYFKMASFSDPFGNGFDLIELYPGGYEAIAADQA